MNIKGRSSSPSIEKRAALISLMSDAPNSMGSGPMKPIGSRYYPEITIDNSKGPKSIVNKEVLLVPIEYNVDNNFSSLGKITSQDSLNDQLHPPKLNKSSSFYSLHNRSNGSIFSRGRIRKGSENEKKICEICSGVKFYHKNVDNRDTIICADCGNQS